MLDSPTFFHFCYDDDSAEYYWKDETGSISMRSGIYYAHTPLISYTSRHNDILQDEILLPHPTPYYACCNDCDWLD